MLRRLEAQIPRELLLRANPDPFQIGALHTIRKYTMTKIEIHNDKKRPNTQIHSCIPISQNLVGERKRGWLVLLFLVGAENGLAHWHKGGLLLRERELALFPADRRRRRLLRLFSCQQKTFKRLSKQKIFFLTKDNGRILGLLGPIWIQDQPSTDSDTHLQILNIFDRTNVQHLDLGWGVWTKFPGR